MSKSKKSSNLASSKLVFWIIGVIAVCIIGFLFLGNHQKSDTNSNSKETIDYTSQPYLGEETAPVSIIEFGDYKCPNCKNFAENVIPLIQQDLVDTGKAKLYFLNDSFINTDSTRAAKFAESVYQELGNKTFWKFHDLLYKKQPEDSKYEKMDIYDEKFLTDTLKEVASSSDVAKVVRNFNEKKSDDAWQRDMDLVKKLGVTGTPTLYVDGKVFEGKSLDDLTKMVDKAAKAKE
ncbi:thioredoxin domain-containing protein [Neobacillus sp. PS3-40]|uniref:DsbA family protein n=1 Tax=Neobacillus sp. PS3-40 TaxID=3070679 RepID=UPI0027E1B83C|nr:thioredoxin domain-containing protein [Neobacillus sp. PS3-40]WML45794.1 thioredoxin domain-containing protein [Neobacillus sp. PS3-40]